MKRYNYICALASKECPKYCAHVKPHQPIQMQIGYKCFENVTECHHSECTVACVDIRKRQAFVCSQCKESASDDEGCYCVKFDLCIEFDGDLARLANGNHVLKCDGEKFEY